MTVTALCNTVVNFKFNRDNVSILCIYICTCKSVKFLVDHLFCMDCIANEHIERSEN